MGKGTIEDRDVVMLVVDDEPGIAAEEGGAGSVPKLHVRHLFGLVRPRTWRFEGLLDRTIIIF